MKLVSISRYFNIQRLNSIIDLQDEDFKAAIEGLQSDEFEELMDALFANPQFQAEIKALEDNGINVLTLLDEVVAIFGQDLESP